MSWKKCFGNTYAICFLSSLYEKEKLQSLWIRYAFQRRISKFESLIFEQNVTFSSDDSKRTQKIDAYWPGGFLEAQSRSLNPYFNTRSKFNSDIGDQYEYLCGCCLLFFTLYFTIEWFSCNFSEELSSDVKLNTIPKKIYMLYILSTHEFIP